MLQEFKNDIYPRRLWIATSWDEVKDKFTTHDADYNFEELNESTISDRPFPLLIDKRSRNKGILIILKNELIVDDITAIGGIVIKSMSAADYLLEDIGVSHSLTRDKEIVCRMVGWIAKCCWKVLQKEIYKNK